MDGIEIRRARWEADKEAMIAVREEVFVREQMVPRELEMDGSDVGCAHVLAHLSDGTAVGTARLDSGGHIGRVAVRAEFRGRGIGKRLMEAVEAVAEEMGFGHVELNSQTHAAGFYRALGYAEEGEEFMEAGIPHVKMTKEIGPERLT